MNPIFEFVSVDPGSGVVPVLVGPLSALMALLPAILVALFGLAITMFKPSFIKRVLQVIWRQKIAVIITAAAVWAVFHFWGALIPSTGEVSVKEDTGDAAWTLWRGGPARKGSVPSKEEPSQGNVNWSYIEGDVKTFYSSPAVVGNRAYIASARYEYFKDTGAVCSVDADTGKEVWKYSENGYRATFSSPSISGKYLVIGEGLHLIKDARIVCIDIEASEQKRKGVKLWDYRTKSHVESSPCIYEDRVFIGAGDDGFFCFALEPNADGSPNLLWHLDGEEFPDCETSPIASGGKVYFGLGIGGQGVCCADTQTGKILWKTDTPYPVFSSPSLSDGNIYFGMGHGDFVNTAESVAANLRTKLISQGKSKEEIEQAVAGIRPIGEIWCLNAESGEKQWDFKVDRTVLGAIAVDGDRLYFNSRDKHVYCLGTDGTLINKWNAKEAIITSPAIGREYIYAVTEGARLYGLDKKTMTPVWDVTLGTDPPFSSPALARGHIYVGTIKNGFLCVGEPSSNERTEPPWEGYLGANGKSGWFDGSLLSPKGSFARWSLPEEGPSQEKIKDLLPVHSPAAYYGGALYTGMNTGEKTGLVKLKLNEEINREPEQVWFIETKNPVYLSPAITAESVFAVDGKKGDAGRKLNIISPENGKPISSTDIDPEASGEFIHSGNLFINISPGKLACFDRIGQKECWTAETGETLGAPSRENSLVAVTNTDSQIIVFDSDQGAEIYREKIQPEITTGPMLKNGRIWVGTDKGLKSVSLITGEEEFYIEAGPAVGRIIGDSTRVCCVTSKGELLIADTATGKERKRLTDAVGEFPPLLTTNALLYNAQNAVNIYDFNTDTAGQWTRLRASWPGLMATPMIMIESHVFFATDKKGLICMKPKK